MSDQPGYFASPEEFFDDLSARRHEPLLMDAAGTLAVELEDGGEKQRWDLRINAGDVEVSHDAPQSVDCTMRMSRESFVAAVQGRGNILASFLRGAAIVEGDAVLALQFQRLFPGPQTSMEMPAERRLTA